jgi:hypothetical protein
MGIQDLGAMGEFISSVAIVITLVVLIYEVRGSKWATLRANVLERQRKRDDVQRSVAESADLANIWVTANHHLGHPPSEAAEFGLEPDQYMRLTLHFSRTFLQLHDAYIADLPEEEREGVENQVRFLLSQPAFSKWYETGARPVFSGASYMGGFFNRVDEIRASL